MQPFRAEFPRGRASVGALSAPTMNTARRVVMNPFERLRQRFRLHEEAGGALLRVRGSVLETSLGAKVPLADAVRVFKFVKLCRKSPNQTAWTRNGASLPVGHFQVDWVSNTGTFRAGCHLIHWDEIVKAAEAAGVLFEEPADTTVKEAA